MYYMVAQERWHAVLGFWVPKPAQVSDSCACLVSCETCFPLIHVLLTVMYNSDDGLKNLNVYPLKSPALVALVPAVEFGGVVESTPYFSMLQCEFSMVCSPLKDVLALSGRSRSTVPDALSERPSISLLVFFKYCTFLLFHR